MTDTTPPAPLGEDALPKKWKSICESAPGWHSLHEKGLMLNEAALIATGEAFSDAEARLSALRGQVARLERERTGMYVNMIAAQSELAVLKAAPLDVEEVMRLAEIAEVAYSNWMDAMANLKPGCATTTTFKDSYFSAREALRQALTKETR